jgi:hypothetical protein
MGPVAASTVGRVHQRDLFVLHLLRKIPINWHKPCLCTTSTAQGHAKDRITIHQKKRGGEEKERDELAGTWFFM